MSIVILRQDDKIDEWKKALKARAPHINVYSYLEEHPKDDMTMALVWKHPKNTLSRYPNLKCISCSGAGVDFIFNDRDRPKHLPITRVVDPYLASDMSEYVLAAIFSHIKNLNHYKLEQTQAKWSPKSYLRIQDVSVGIMGVGELGKTLAKDLVQYGFKTLGWSNSKKRINGVNSFVGEAELSLFLEQTAILVCLLPLTNKTKGILNKTLFTLLPKGAFVINVARGGHMVDDDLMEMLDKDHLSGAVLDVFHNEPLPTSHLYWQHPKVHITPHIASVSDTASVVPQIVENYERLMSGQPLLNEVSITKGY
ncbi:2-hydroxyacid dehydrogenase [Costertonia aggregata]|uniref:Glyoxylate/hydroxypyruvate reductase A n=1 Tax=Costertonia aggregata TaxID=343403 RepID=A0A7H9AU39_9FLAO|nr:glyoxylate/hydroxypyruvate reductase A [Costertonia aggregata]QLG47011.1 glyoxylate/hydroxypyruvate reductase A [Costertonia aggregata]